MPREVEAGGKTVDEAVAKALAELGLDKSQVDIKVLAEGRQGILGLGGENARVLVRALEVQTDNDVVEEACNILDNLLKLMSIQASVNWRPPETPGDGLGQAQAVLEVQGDDLGILIGRRGETLASLQYVVNLILSRKFKAFQPISLDVDGYRKRREESLKGLALRMAERVKATGETITLEPMPPNERRIVHLALAQDPAVVTVSLGEGDHRKVAISPRP